MKIYRKVWGVEGPFNRRYFIYIRCGHSPIMRARAPKVGSVLRCQTCQKEAEGYISAGYSERGAIAAQDESEDIPRAERGKFHDRPPPRAA